MTSQINPNNIDGNYPVAGIPNNTQGFRDNFTNIKTNFQYAETEIDDLQNKAVLKQPLSGGTLDNNMNDNLIYAVKMNDVSFTALQQTTTAGTVTIDYSAAAWQTVTPTNNVSLAFSNWPASGSYGVVNIEFVITNTAYTVTLPTSVVNGLLGLAGWDSGTRTITFYQTGSFRYSFSTVNGGTAIQITDFDRPRNVFFSQVNVSNTTPSTSTTTGALVVAGGVGVGANLNVGGDFATYNTSNSVVFSANATTGFVKVTAPVVRANSIGAFNIVGSADGYIRESVQAGTMLHVTGNDGVGARIFIDTAGTGSSVYSGIISRRSRGTASSPTAVQAGDILSRHAGAGWGTTKYALTSANISPTRIDLMATETYTDTTAGSQITMYTAANGSNVAVLSANVTATVTTFPGNVSVSGTGGVFLTDSGTMGYGTGAGGTVSQTGNKSTGVTLNKPSGEITMQATALGASTSVSFTLTNSTIGARDVMIVNLVGGGTAGAYTYGVNCSAGSAVITVRNVTAGSLSEALVLRYVVIKGSIA